VHNILKQSLPNFRPASGLLGKNLLAFLILTSSTPLLTHAREPSQFGTLSLLIFFGSLVSVISTLRLEAAVPVSSSIFEVVGIVVIASIMTLIFLMIDINTIALGSGFNYVAEFGCEFLKYVSGDYPHYPPLSGLLASGLLGLFARTLLMAWALFVGLRLFIRSGNQLEWGASIIATVMFTSISGNTLFSMLVFFVVLIYGTVQPGLRNG
jgi:hypothetical protein